MSSTKKPKSFVCSYCEKTFSFHNQLVVHIRQHTGEKPFQCEICHKSFASLKVLKVHERVHTGERPYKCPYCEKSFSAYANLVVHRRIHTHEKPYQCKLCKRAFEHSGNLSRHFRAHMTDFGFRCILCSRIFDKDFELLEHTKIDHSNEYMSYTLNHNNNNRHVMNKNTKTKSDVILASSSSEGGNLTGHSYLPVIDVQNGNHESGIPDDNSTHSSHFTSTCSLNEISSTTETILPKKWRTKHAHLKQYLKPPSDLGPLYNKEGNGERDERYSKTFCANEVKLAPYHTRVAFESTTPPQSADLNIVNNRDNLEETYRDNLEGSYLPKHLKFKKFANLHKENIKYYSQPPARNDDINIVYDMRKQNITGSNPPPLIPIDKVRFDEDEDTYPVDLSYHVRGLSTKDHPCPTINDRYENMYPANNIDVEKPKIDDASLPNAFEAHPGAAMFDAPHFMKGMLQRTNVFNFYVSELKKFTFRKKVEKVLCALLGKAKLKDFGYPEKSCEQVLIRILDTINQTPCADVRVDEEDRFRINVRLLLERSFPDEKSQQKLGWMGKSVDFILDQIISQEKERNMLTDIAIAWHPTGEMI